MRISMLQQRLALLYQNETLHDQGVGVGCSWHRWSEDGVCRWLLGLPATVVGDRCSAAKLIMLVDIYVFRIFIH